MNSSSIHRYSNRPLPPYSYIPGSGTPHPVSDPRGHMHGISAETAAPLDPDDWQRNETYLYAVDLFNHGFYWEAHEAWESLWHAAGHRGQTADFLKGLIKFAAAGVKHCEGNAAGVRRHLERGQELLRSTSEREALAGVGIHRILNRIAQLIAEPTKPFSLKLELGPLPA